MSFAVLRSQFLIVRTSTKCALFRYCHLLCDERFVEWCGDEIAATAAAVVVMEGRTQMD